MDVSTLSRVQFAVTIGFHFLFPPITIGLAWLLVIVETFAWRRGDKVYDQMGRLFAKLLGLTFAIGVATGVVMEFQFGTNWARYSRFVGDIFGAPLAAEGVFAFFLESIFLGVYLFARDRVSKKVHWISALMVAVGSTLSAFWIIVANSWMQTPAGFKVETVEVNGVTVTRARLTDFWAAVFNDSTLIRYGHTVMAAAVCGAFFMAGCSAWMLLCKRDNVAVTAVAARALKLALVFGLVTSMLVGFPLGHWHARQVAHTQPEKFAAIEGLYSENQEAAPLVMFGLVNDQPPKLKARIELPGMLSRLAFGDIHAKIPGIMAFPENERPPLWITFVSFHNMVILGMLFMATMALGLFLWWRGRLEQSRRYLWFVLAISWLPLAACQFGWTAAEVGRQPWIVYKKMRTVDAISNPLTVPVGQVWASLILFVLVYLLLLGLYLFLLRHTLRHAEQKLGPPDSGAGVMPEARAGGKEERP